MDKRFYDYAVEKRGLTNRLIAESLGISEASLRNRLNGKTNFKISEAKKIAEILRLSALDFEVMFF